MFIFSGESKLPLLLLKRIHRSLSMGLEAVFGSSFLVDSACIALNPPMPAIVTAASDPPDHISVT
jgi:hypothetical protein